MPVPLGPVSTFLIVKGLSPSLTYHVEGLGFEVRDPDGYVLVFGRPARLPRHGQLVATIRPAHQ